MVICGLGNQIVRKSHRRKTVAYDAAVSEDFTPDGNPIAAPGIFHGKSMSFGVGTTVAFAVRSLV
jgi:hypothetical protein